LSIKRQRKIELGFLTKRFDKNEIATYNNKLKRYRISNTELVILQDSTDRFLSLKGDILNEIKGSQKMDDRDVKIARLENEIMQNRFDDVSIYKESTVLFPTIDKFSIANHKFLLQKDSVFKQTIVIISSKEPLVKEEKDKFELWLKTKLNLKQIQVLQEVPELKIQEKTKR
jgi:hypothetical protein